MAPNKIIFQLGILGFCITAVVLGVQEVSIMETVIRSFIVFVGVVLTVTLVLVASSALLAKRDTGTETKSESGVRPAQREMTGAKRQGKTV